MMFISIPIGKFDIYNKFVLNGRSVELTTKGYK